MCVLDEHSVVVYKSNTFLIVAFPSRCLNLIKRSGIYGEFLFNITSDEVMQFSIICGVVI